MKNKNFKIASLVFCFFSGMFFLAFASVPLYNLFCKVTGYGGTPKLVELPSTYVSDKTIKVRFNADVSKKLKLYFQPIERQIITKLGKSNTVDYEVINNTKKDILILISYSGNTAELKNIIRYAKLNKILLISIVSNKNSILYKLKFEQGGQLTCVNTEVSAASRQLTIVAAGDHVTIVNKYI